MMSKNDFPEIDEFYLGRYGQGLSPQPRAIYMLTLVAVIAFLLCLPYIKINISVSSPGVLQTSANKILISSSSNGIVIKSLVHDNQKVGAGDTLLLLDASGTEKLIALNSDRQFLLEQYLDDLQLLLRTELGKAGIGLKSGKYQASYQLFLEEKQERDRLADQESRNFQRFNTLYENKMISDAEFERHKHASEMAAMAAFTFQMRYRAQLEQEASIIRQELQVLASTAIDLRDQEKQSVIKSPDKGSIQLRKEIKTGTSISANEVLAEISPDSTLMAYCYVGPADIALIRIGQEVYFQVAAFNYNEWGLLEGRVQEISDDVMTRNDSRPVYQIRCLINTEFMGLKKGLRGSLKRGMTLNARFKTDRRSLSQLLFDRVDDWINSIQESESTSNLNPRSK